MPLLDYFYVLQFENKEYFKSFKLDEDGYLTSNDLHCASKLQTMYEVIEVASELKTRCNVQCEVREIQVVTRQGVFRCIKSNGLRMGKRKALLQKVGLNGLLYWKIYIKSGLNMRNGSGFEKG
ncbi:hypothetical protein C7M29_03055 [Bacillus subtilis]|nr:hypothetical protein C7M29_03055 [Bacillus subtilis]